MLPDEEPGRTRDGVHVERAAERPAPASVEGGCGVRRRPDPIPVAPEDRLAARIEAVVNGLGVPHPDCAGEHGIQRPDQLRGRPGRGHRNRRHLAGCVDTRVGATRAENCPVFAGEPGHDRLQRALHRGFAGLDLPAVKVRAVVVEGKLEAGRLVAHVGWRLWLWGRCTALCEMARPCVGWARLCPASSDDVGGPDRAKVSGVGARSTVMFAVSRRHRPTHGTLAGQWPCRPNSTSLMSYQSMPRWAMPCWSGFRSTSATRVESRMS